MEFTSCNVIYVDRKVREDRQIIRGQTPREDEWESDHIAENTRLLTDIFGSVHLCSTGGACLSQWLDLQDTSLIELKPTLILIDTPFQDRIPERSRSRSPSPHSLPDIDDESNHEEDLYGLSLLRRIVTESYVRNLSRLVIPIPLIVFPRPAAASDQVDGASDAKGEATNSKLDQNALSSQRVINRRMVKKCLELGAIDIMACPMNSKCINNLETHAYRAHREAAREQKALLEVRRGRKRSWVGISEDKPFSYLREAMVSGLMSGICRIGNENDDGIGNVRISVSAERQLRIADAVGYWHFCAHSFSDDELIVAAALMFKHALAMPELEKWRVPTDQLYGFLVACRAAYNTFVPYHNFRHVVDVLQATFNFLVHIGALPPYPTESSNHPSIAKSPIAELLQPFDALTLLITAIGHDVGHPGVNNGFLVTLNAPLAQLYNDRSVLESFHCAAYSQILRRHWPAAFGDTKMRSLMISSILATDMGLHFDYMKKLGDLQEKLKEKNSTEGWNGRTIDEHKALACALLIKCADISNVARRHDTAVQWMHVLADEFSRQATMETELEIQSSLASPPKKDLLSLSKAQLSFMNLFAIPLFQGVADILPTMQYTVDELDRNQLLFQQSMAEEQSKHDPASELLKRAATTLQVPAEPQKQPPPPPLTTQDSLTQGLLAQTADVMKKPPHVPTLPDQYKEVNGIVTTFDSVADFARSDPFNVNDMKPQGATKQRGSEATEGGSVPCSGDWASQATSATTGKMPLSPSTQGTSIISRDSLERPTSVPVTTITAPESTTTAPESATGSNEMVKPSHSFPDDINELSSLNGSTPTPTDVDVDYGKSLKKKPSRFRINNLPFFRRHKSPSPPIKPADMVG
ncbi:3'5'-cyclic nucleotide phosphodiesterase [Thozetella sp. PMI_491]|nr:3'5'-cyclic nucleotide phosphodiesterase [Thozetella sp. PMI_491]